MPYIARRDQPLILRGTMTTFRRRCGKATCHCATGEPHESPALTYTEAGRTKTLTLSPAEVAEVAAALAADGHANVVAHPNSRRLLDSYNWSLMRVLAEHEAPVFDYVFLDGAHTWAHDALAFVLADRLLAEGGYLDFDDYAWSLRDSPTMNPQAFPDVERLYTDEQIDARQVALVVDVLVRRDGRYEEVVPNKIFRKGPAPA